MATASPTPMASLPVRRTSQRQALRRPPSRPMLNRSESQPASAMGAADHRPQSKQYNDDSSEDEIPVPMKLSALTKALLNDGEADGSSKPHEKAPSPRRTRQRSSVLSAAAEERRHLRSGSAQASEGRSFSKADTSAMSESSPARKRVVRLSSEHQSLSQMQPGTRRSTSTSRSTLRNRPASRPASRQDSREKPEEEQRNHRVSSQTPRSGINTPNQAGRVVHIASGSSANRNRVGSSGAGANRAAYDRSIADKSAVDYEHDQSEVAPDTVPRHALPAGTGSVSRYPSTITRGRLDENGNLQGSMRIKRVGKTPGSFLSGPARRGRRRQSEEEEDGHPDGEAGATSGQDPDNRVAYDRALSSFYGDGMRDFNSGSPVGGAAARATHRRQASNAEVKLESARTSPKEQARETQPEPQHVETLESEVPMPHIKIPSALDQENQAPPSYKRPKLPAELVMEKAQKQPLNADIGIVRAASPERKPLAARDQNTPRRPAPPPPPKMSVLEAATSKTGAAATTQAKQRRNILRVNGKCYTRLDCLGRGGSAKVYRVMAENGTMFALKRVALENADETTIRGCRGEIDLLTRLSAVDRVINLFDYEMNEEKQVLTLLMEMGELDFNTLLRSRQNSETAKFDPVFVRYYWKEMLQCLQLVHQESIVHSDLKPLNFVLVQGRLKLIDFGIAGAIQTEETVNVHRETQNGTPNYMSPESLLDSNNPRGGGGRLAGRPKLMKLGKPSDVWSLGCILYQMVYGLPPFGHIANQMARCQAIINWDHVIEFPTRAMGGVPVPPSLIRTMKRCLNRDHQMRPSCEELLHESDPFLYPIELSDKALPIDEELLGRIIQSVVTRCRERMPTEAEIANVWPQAYWTSVRKATANRMR